MSFQTQKPRTFTYRIPLDDKKALRKVRICDRLNDDYWITKLPSNKVPTGKAVRNWACVFYQSTEHHDWETDELVGGTIPGLHEYRFSLDWVPTPESELLEMKNANGGGTRIRGEKFIGTHDPRLPDYAPVDTVVPWTPTEIEAMYRGESVPDKMNYTHDAPPLPAENALRQFREEIEISAREGLDDLEEQLWEYIQNCGHKHTDESHGVEFCEDCGHELEA